MREMDTGHLGDRTIDVAERETWNSNFVGGLLGGLLDCS